MAVVDLKILLSAIDKATPALVSVQDSLKAGADAAADFESKWGGALQTVQRVGMGMMAAGGAITGALIMAGKAAGEYGGQIFDATRRTGMAAEELTALKYAAEQSGVGFEELVPSLNKMQRSINDAVTGSKPMIEAFKVLGVSVTDAGGKVRPTQEIFEDVATAIAAIPDEAIRADMAMTIFGRGGAALLPMLMETGEGIRKLTDEAHKLGLTMSDETAAAMDAAGDKMDAAKEVMLSAWRAIGAQVAPIMAKIAMTLAELVAKIKAFADEHPLLSKAVTLIFGAGGVLLVGLGAAAVAFTALIGKIVAAKAAMLAFGETAVGMKVAGGLLSLTGALSALPATLTTVGASLASFFSMGTAAAGGLAAGIGAVAAGVAALGIALAVAFKVVQRTYKVFLEMRIAQEEAKQAEQDYEDAKRGAQAADRYVMNKREWAEKQGYSGPTIQAAQNVEAGKTLPEQYGPKTQQRIKEINEGYLRYFREENARIALRQSTERRLAELRVQAQRAEQAAAEARVAEAKEGAAVAGTAPQAAPTPGQATAAAMPMPAERPSGLNWPELPPGVSGMGAAMMGAERAYGAGRAIPDLRDSMKQFMLQEGGAFGLRDRVTQARTTEPAVVIHEIRLSNDGETSRILLSNPAARDQICRTIRDVAMMIPGQFG